MSPVRCEAPASSAPGTRSGDAECSGRREGVEMPWWGWRGWCPEGGGDHVSVGFERPAASREGFRDSVERVWVRDAGSSAVKNQIEVGERDSEAAAGIAGDVPSFPRLRPTDEVERVVRPEPDDACDVWAPIITRGCQPAGWAAAPASGFQLVKLVDCSRPGDLQLFRIEVDRLHGFSFDRLEPAHRAPMRGPRAIRLDSSEARRPRSQRVSLPDSEQVNSYGATRRPAPVSRSLGRLRMSLTHRAGARKPERLGAVFGCELGRCEATLDGARQDPPRTP